MQIRARFLVFVAAGLASTSLARAESGEAPATRGPAFDAGDVRWRSSFRRVGWPEYVAAPALLLGAFAADLALSAPAEAGWSGPILFDRSMQHWLRADSASGRQRADIT